jgi:hypothetical protein
MQALYGCAASIAWLSLGLPGVALDVTLPWVVIPVLAFAAAFWLASRYRAPAAGKERVAGQALDVPRRSAPYPGAVRPPGPARGAIGVMALFWAGDALAVWLALAASGFVMNGAALLVGYCTGMVFTRRVAPLAGAGTLALIGYWGSSGQGERGSAVLLLSRSVAYRCRSLP